MEVNTVTSYASRRLSAEHRSFSLTDERRLLICEELRVNEWQQESGAQPAEECRNPPNRLPQAACRGREREREQAHTRDPTDRPQEEVAPRSSPCAPLGLIPRVTSAHRRSNVPPWADVRLRARRDLVELFALLPHLLHFYRHLACRI